MSRHGHSRKSNENVFKYTLHSSNSVLPARGNPCPSPLYLVRMYQAVALDVAPIGTTGTNDPNRAKSVVELFWLSSESFLQSSDCRIYFESLPLPPPKILTIIQTHGAAWPCNNFTSIPFFLFLFYLSWEVCESVPQKATQPSAQGCLLTAGLRERKPCAYMERCVSELLYRADGISMGWGN